MKTIFLTIAASLTFAASNVPALASESAGASDEAALLALEQTWIDAGRAQDYKTLDAMIDDSFVADTPTGKAYKQDSLRPQATTPSQSLRNMSVRIEGDTATVSGENFVTEASGHIYTLAFVDTFKRRDGTWRVVHSYVTR
jgi:ketosteroid isomerase-like protein